MDDVSLAELERLCRDYCVDNATRNLSVCDEDLYVDCLMYPKQYFGLAVLLPVTVLLLAVLVTGVVGNLAVIVVILCQASMRTATDFYLLNLAVSDLLLLLFGLPQELLMYWRSYPDVLGQFMCRLKTLVTATANDVSVLTIVAVSLERYIAICHPLHTLSATKLRRVGSVIGAIWIVCLSCGMLYTLQFNIQYRVEYPPDSSTLSEKSAVCGTALPLPESLDDLLEITSVVFFLLPLTLLTIVYARIGFSLRSRQYSKFQNVKLIERRQAQNKTAITLLAAVVIGFFICWAPFHYQRLVSISLTDPHQLRIIYVSTGVFYFVSAALNPILYNAMSHRYRTAFRNLCKRFKISFKINLRQSKKPSKSNSHETKTIETQV